MNKIKKVKNKKVKNKRIIFYAGIISLFLVFSPLFVKKSQAFWGEFVQETFHFTLLTAKENVEGIARSAVKQQGYLMLSGMVDKFMGGNGSGNVAFIVNWEDYLIQQPIDETKAYMNDYISQMTRGRGSLTGYQAEGFSGSGNYYASLNQMAKNTIEQKDNVFRLTYEGDPVDMFQSGSFKDMNSYLVNTPWAVNMAVNAEYDKKLKENMLARQEEAQANQGFVGTRNEAGSITYPGILTKEMTANIEDLPNKITAAANSIPEIISAVMAQTITRSMTQGFPSVLKNSQMQNSVEDKVESSLEILIDQNGPGARFNLSRERTN